MGNVGYGWDKTGFSFYLKNMEEISNSGPQCLKSEARERWRDGVARLRGMWSGWLLGESKETKRKGISRTAETPLQGNSFPISLAEKVQPSVLVSVTKHNRKLQDQVTGL